MLAIVMPTLSESSVTLIFRLASMTSRLMMIATLFTSDRQIILRLDLNGTFQQLLKNRGKKRNHHRSECREKTDQHRGVVFFSHIVKERQDHHIQGIVLDLLQRRERQLRIDFIPVNILSSLNA